MDQQIWKTNPIPNTHDGSMGLVYLPTFTIKFTQIAGKYTSPMDAMG